MRTSILSSTFVIVAASLAISANSAAVQQHAPSAAFEIRPAADDATITPQQSTRPVVAVSNNNYDNHAGGADCLYQCTAPYTTNCQALCTGTDLSMCEDQCTYTGAFGQGSMPLCTNNCDGMAEMNACTNNCNTHGANIDLPQCTRQCATAGLMPRCTEDCVTI